jgi:hypothetical protein
LERRRKTKPNSQKRFLEIENALKKENAAILLKKIVV